MVRVRRSVWLAAVVCGVLLMSLVTFLSRQGGNPEKAPVGQEETEGVQQGGLKQQDEGMMEEGEDSSLSFEEKLDPYSTRGGKKRGRLLGAAKLDLSREPKLGEVVKLTFAFTAGEDLPQLKIVFDARGGIEIVGGTGVAYTSMREGDTKSFRADLRFLSSPAFVVAKAVKYGYTAAGEEKEGLELGRGLRRVIIDEETKQFGTVGEYINHPSRRVFMLYNHLEPRWMSEPDQGFEMTNRKIAQEMKKYEPALGDSEALCLHADNYRLIINAIGDPEAGDAGRIRHLLEAGWLKAQRGGAEVKEKWLKEFMEKNKGRWGGRSKLDFLPDRERHNGVTDLGGGGPSEQVTTTFIGQWIYKKHSYDKDQGLLWETVETPVSNAEVGIRAYWSGHGTIWVGWGMTDDLGNFEVTTDSIPGSATNVRAYPNLYTWGPERYDERIKVSKPSWQSIQNPRDTTIWHLGRSDFPPSNPVTPGGTCDFGICYPETAIVSSRKQPRSGAANIYEALLQGYEYLVPTYTSPGEIGRVRALWEPRYIPPLDTASYYSSGDTIFVVGLDSVDTDEWDDGVLIHEYGHHVQNHCAQIPPTSTWRDDWWRSYPLDQGLAYAEGWPYMLASVDR